MPLVAPQQLKERTPPTAQETFRYTTPDRKVAATPVDAYVKPAPGLASVIDALKETQGGLDAYFKYKDVKNKQDEEAGALAHARGEELQTNTSYAFIRGYEHMKGQAAAADYHAEMAEFLLKNVQADPETFSKGIESLRNKYINGVSDSYLKGFVPKAMSTESQVEAKYKEESFKLIREDQISNIRKISGDKIESLLVDYQKTLPKIALPSGGGYTGGTVVGGVNLKGYAVDKNHIPNVSKLYNQYKDLNSPEQIDAVIKSTYPNSPITGAMIINSASKAGIPPGLLTGLLQWESHFGTAGLATKTRNPGNVGGDTPGPEWYFNSWDKGVDVAANQLRRRKVSGSTVQNDTVVEPSVDFAKQMQDSRKGLAVAMREELDSLCDQYGDQMTKDEITGAYLQMAIEKARQNKDPSLLAFVYEKGRYGVPLESTKFGMKIEEALRTVESYRREDEAYIERRIEKQRQEDNRAIGYRILELDNTADPDAIGKLDDYIKECIATGRGDLSTLKHYQDIVRTVRVEGFARNVDGKAVSELTALAYQRKLTPEVLNNFKNRIDKATFWQFFDQMMRTESQEKSVQQHKESYRENLILQGIKEDVKNTGMPMDNKTRIILDSQSNQRITDAEIIFFNKVNDLKEERKAEGKPDILSADDYSNIRKDTLTTLGQMPEYVNWWTARNNMQNMVKVTAGVSVSGGDTSSQKTVAGKQAEVVELERTKARVKKDSSDVKAGSSTVNATANTLTSNLESPEDDKEGDSIFGLTGDAMKRAFVAQLEGRGLRPDHFTKAFDSFMEGMTKHYNPSKYQTP